MTDYKGDKFWSEDPSILYNINRLSEFFISKDQTTNEKLNSITRFGIYTSIILAMYNKNYNYLLLSIIAFLFTFFIYDNNQKQEKFDSNDSKSEVNLDNVTHSTLSNPFGNNSVFDIADNPEKPPMADYVSASKEAKQEKELVEKNYNYNLYKQAGEDIFGKQNGQRMFYTVADKGSIPHDPNGEFRDWVYKDVGSCKTNTFDCSNTLYEDIRFKRR